MKFKRGDSNKFFDDIYIYKKENCTDRDHYAPTLQEAIKQGIMLLIRYIRIYS